MVELEDLVFTPGLLPFWRKSIFHNGPGSLRLLWPQSQWHFGRQLHVWSDPLLERGLGSNRGLHRRPARHSNGTALAWDVFGHQHQRCENWARHEEKKLAGDESVMCHRGQWWGLLGHTFLFCIAANHWCLAHLRMFGLVQEIPRMASTWTSTTIPLPTPRAARSWSPLRRIRPMSHSMCPGAKDHGENTVVWKHRNGKVIDPIYCQVVVVYEPHQLPIYAP